MHICEARPFGKTIVAALLTSLLVLSPALLPARAQTNAEPLPHPYFVGYEEFVQGNYLAPVLGLKKLEAQYLNSDLKSDYLQAIATYLSFVSRYREALEYFDRLFESASPAPAQQTFPLRDYRAVPLAEAMAELAQANQAVVINEAHHVPQHRATTFLILRRLYENGFRYFAAEGFSPADEAALNQRRYPTMETGFYTSEPTFGELIRYALNLGYKLVAYEYLEPCDYVADPNGCQDKRERGQAQNLKDKIFQADPHAKVVVHAGYGHIDEIGGGASFPWVPMAAYFRDFTGINPLTLDQVDMRERGQARLERYPYAQVVDGVDLREPFILKSRADQQAWTGVPGTTTFRFSTREANTKAAGRPGSG